MTKNIKIHIFLITSLLVASLMTGCGGSDSSSNNIETVQDFVADARTWGTVIQKETETRGSALETRFTTAGQVFDSIGPVLNTAMSIAFDAAGKAYVSNSTIDLNDFDTVVGATNPIDASGTAIVDGSTVTVTGSVISMTTVTYDNAGNPINTPQAETATIQLVLSFPASLNATSFTVDIISGTATSSTAVMDISTGTVTLNYGAGVDITPWISGSNTILPFPSFDSANAAFTVAISETRSDPVSFEGTLQFSIIGAQIDGVVQRVPATGEVVQYNPDDLLLSGRFGTGSDYFSAEFSALVPNAETFIPLAPAYVAGNVYDIGSYLFSNNGDTVTIDVPGKNYVMTFDGSTATPMVNVSSTYSYVGAPTSTYSVQALSLLDFLASIDNPLNNDTWLYIVGQGYYDANVPTSWDTTVGGAITGTLTYADTQPEENAENFLMVQDLKMNFIVQLAGLPQAKYEIIANRTDFEGGNVSISAAYGKRSITFSAATIANGEAQLTITVTNNEDDTLIITFDSLTGAGEVTFNGVVEATLQQDALGVIIITYNDGTFESLM